MEKKIRYAVTVISGERPLIVCTSDTGIRDIASEFRMWPPIWKAVSGSVAMTISRFGRRMPFFRTGSRSRTVELCLASQERNMHQKETRRNCTMVRVTGRGRAVKMAFEDVFVRIEVPYQSPHRS